MRFKKPRSLGYQRENDRVAQQYQDSNYAVQYLKDNVLLCYRVRVDVPPQTLVRLVYLLEKCKWFANAALYAKTDDTHYVLLFGALDEASAESLRQNITNVVPFPELEKCEVPSTGAEGFVPLGLILPKAVGEETTRLLAQDPDIIEIYNQGIVNRMDAQSEGDFIFPDLSPEEYEAVKERMNNKPQ